MQAKTDYFSYKICKHNIYIIDHKNIRGCNEKNCQEMRNIVAQKNMEEFFSVRNKHEKERKNCWLKKLENQDKLLCEKNINKLFFEEYENLQNSLF